MPVDPSIEDFNTGQRVTTDRFVDHLNRQVSAVNRQVREFNERERTDILDRLIWLVPVKVNSNAIGGGRYIASLGDWASEVNPDLDTDFTDPRDAVFPDDAQEVLLTNRSESKRGVVTHRLAADSVVEAFFGGNFDTQGRPVFYCNVTRKLTDVRWNDPLKQIQKTWYDEAETIPDAQYSEVVTFDPCDSTGATQSQSPSSDFNLSFALRQ